ncbi:hypothetical protein COU58_02240 [Candidatus Pacearchaeota archaeon CG10_big_fil_rev_8_21_14_0_10_32_42]|nr:MAG: hypothetical protein COU58_02240 [Candidatus Pacearchaeota archaeon CG10_big_fil_rev_8_21_14_0_10_32_42]
MISLWEKFEERLDEPLGFGWNEDWSNSLGVEKFDDYVRTFSKDSSLPLFEEDKHFNEVFSGFVAFPDKELKIEKKIYEADFLFIQKGKVRYINSSEGNNKVFSEKESFHNNNFVIYRSFFGGENPRLNHIRRSSSFNFSSGQNLEILQFCSDKVCFYLDCGNPLEFLYWGVDNSFVKENFSPKSPFLKDFNLFFDLVKNFKSKVLKNDPWFHGKFFKIEEGLKYISF